MKTVADRFGVARIELSNRAVQAGIGRHTPSAPVPAAAAQNGVGCQSSFAR